MTIVFFRVFHSADYWDINGYTLWQFNRKLWKIIMLLMGKLIISMATFNSYVKSPQVIYIICHAIAHLHIKKYIISNA